MQIAGREIGGENPPYIIAEISGNHCGDYYEALRLIERAHFCGADAVKFQCYTPDTITINCNSPDFVMQDGPWKGKTLYELYQRTHTPFEWFPKLFQHCESIGITALASVFDKSSVDLLESLDAPAYKIASFEITDKPLIQYAAKTGKPVIVSTGMASSSEILEATGDLHWEKVALLHCVSGYPTSICESNLGRILEFRKYYSCAIGISDHTLGWEVPVAATALGAKIIEKHLISSRDMPSEDADFSLTPPEFMMMVDKVKEIWKALHTSELKSEESSRQARRSLYVVKDILAGEIFTEENIRSIRPGYGLAPVFLPEILGESASCNIKRGTALTWTMIRRLRARVG